ncbi:DNA helicase/exodeoxyribonuclease V gamma subunit [Crenobacter luteus]|uniref:exodeoxyribonuclease V subunit gamma n=1 Tax=Crenobacter luteus TaxID=1452487 RepID=UPI00104D42A3|nr:exodeoxyribonuclease V subunit gamma [Crenobacter luteus]TCP10929.1 DNA helicase/exodeoxyribonuclease V gamma subunit [Crenobacter luteus]
MLYLYQSNRLERLGEFFAQLTRAVPLADPFEPETVIVQSRGMGRWLTQTLARENGVAAHIDFVLPAAYAWRLMRAVLPELPAKSPFSPAPMQWRLMALFPTLEGDEFAPLLTYLAGGERAAFELAGKVADIFDQYLVFRPAWLKSWEAGQLLGLSDDEVWQAALWRRLAAETPGVNRIGMLDALFSGLKKEHLPERVVLFGIASLAPMYLALVKRLAELTDVCFFALSPCAEAWGDIVDARGQLALFGDEQDASAAGHPLLASLGKQGRDFFDLLLAECANELSDVFDAPEGDTLLARLQRDLLTLTPPGEAVAPLAPADRSVELHVTHGPMRELEVLKDRLLAMFEADPTLTPADVAVLTPDINAYAPYIDAVFARRDDAPSLPYTLADRQRLREHPLVTTLAELLTLFDSRFEAEAVLALFDCPALMRRFALAEGELPLIRDWVRRAGIRWGRDAAHKAACGAPGAPRFSWRWGLDRLLLGSVLPEGLAGVDTDPCFAGLLPAAGADGQLADALSRFVAAVEALLSWADAWQAPAAPADWAARMNALADALFEAGDDAEEAALQLWRDAAAELAEDAALADFAAPVGQSVLRDWLSRRLAETSSGGFLAGAITFCAMVPMRSLPFRVICLVGMNDGAYPRDERPVSFDLIARHPARGDRSRRFDDRYLFLEALLSARDVLYLSYVGRSARSNEPLPPSPLLSELFDAFDAMTGGAARAALSVEHPLQPFSPLCYPDDERDARASFEPSYAAALAAGPREATPFAAPLPIARPALVRLETLVRFWRHPARFWLAERLGIRPARRDEALPESEPFGLSPREREAMRAAWLDAYLTRRPNAPVASRLVGAGLVPDGALGDAWLHRERDDGLAFAARLPATLAEPELPPEPFAIDLDGQTLCGELSGLRAAGRIGVLARASHTAERIAWWLEHLALCAARPVGVTPVSRWYAADALYDFAPIPADTARAHLAAWLAHFNRGLVAPLPFFPRTSWAFAEARAKNPDDLAKAFGAARAKWAPAYVADGGQPQSEEAEVRLAFRATDPLADPDFVQLADALLLPLLQHLGGDAS